MLLSEINSGAAVPPLAQRVSTYIAWLARNCKGCMRRGGNCRTCPAEPAAGLDAEIRAAGGSTEIRTADYAALAPKALPSDPDELVALAARLRKERRAADRAARKAARLAARANPRMAAIAAASAEVLARLSAAAVPLPAHALAVPGMSDHQMVNIRKQLVRSGAAVLTGCRSTARYSIAKGEDAK